MSLPGLGVVAIKAKLDTGAKTSALHAWDLSVREVEGRQWIQFHVYPSHGKKAAFIVCEAPVSDRRWVTISNGERELRYVIATNLQIGFSCWPIELSLTNREAMECPMIIGREALRNHAIVDPMASFLAGKIVKEKS